jgi:hypothetical protein
MEDLQHADAIENLEDKEDENNEEDTDNDNMWDDASNGSNSAPESPTPAPRGRPSTAQQNSIEETFQKVDELFADVSARISKHLSTIIGQWNHTHNYGVKTTCWNQYQKYWAIHFKDKHV